MAITKQEIGNVTYEQYRKLVDADVFVDENVFIEGIYEGTFVSLETGWVNDLWKFFTFTMDVDGETYTKRFDSKPKDDADVDKAVARFALATREIGKLGRQLTGKQTNTMDEINACVGKPVKVWVNKNTEGYLDFSFREPSVKITPIKKSETVTAF